MHITLPKGKTFFVFCAIFIILIAGCPTPVDNPVDTATPPGTMVAPTLTAGNGQLTVAWTEPTDGGSAITEYHLRHSADGGTNWSDIINVAVPATSHPITELRNGTSYSVQVRAVNARGEGKWSPSAEGIPVDVPMAPTGLALTVGDETLTATWTELEPTDTGGSPILHYAVEHREPEAEWPQTPSASTADAGTLTLDIPNLKNGTEYEVRVYAVNDQGDGNRSEIAAATPATVPDKPNAPTLTAGNEQLTATWTAPDNGGNAIIRYEVQYRTSSPQGQWTTSSSADSDVTDTSHTVTGLTNGIMYEVQVRAVNSVAEDAGNGAGVGAWSTSATETPVDVPKAPTGLALTVGNGKLTATWEKPTDTGGSPILRYAVEHREKREPEAEWPPNPSASTADADTLTLDITGLTNGTEYEVRVYAVNDQGPGNPSDIAAATPATVPNVIRLEDGIRSPNGQHSIFITFPLLTESDTGGSKITQYDLRYKKSDVAGWTELTNITFIKTEGGIFITIDTETIQAKVASNPLLEAGTFYNIEVRAVNAIGAGDWSATVSVTTISAVEPKAPGNFMITARDESIVVTWTVPDNGGSPITGYSLQYGDPHPTNPQSLSLGSIGVAIDKNAVTHTITGLQNGKTYRVYMFAFNAIGNGTHTVAKDATPIGPPKAPTGLTLTMGTDAQLGVGWTAPTDDGGTDTGITKYELEYKLSSGNWDTSADVTRQTIASATPPVPTTATITGLTNGSAYHVRVRAVNSEGDGDWSTSAAATPVAIPDKIVISETPASTSTRYSISISWSLPDHNGSPIDRYDLQYKKSVEIGWTELTGITLNADGQSFTLDTEAIRADNPSNPILAAGTAYNIAVRAVNPQGTGDWSDTASVTTQAENSGSTKPAVPSFAIAGGDGQIVVNWSAPDDGDSEITYYVVWYGDPSSDGSTLVANTREFDTIVDGSATTHTITGLTNGKKYGVYVQACNRIGCGDPDITPLKTVEL